MTPYQQRLSPTTRRMLQCDSCDHHPHVHALVPGGGPLADGTRWIRRTTCPQNTVRYPV